MLEEGNPMPYHYQIKQLLKKEIFAGHYEAKIPSERELMERFSVSRTTIREAVNHLVQEGILKKVHGKGTFVTQSKTIEEWLHTLHSLTDTVKKMGLTPGSELLEIKKIDERPKIFNKKINDSQMMIKRLRTANGNPIAIERHYVGVELGEQLKKYNLDEVTIYDVMENELEVDMHEAEQSISCKRVEDEDAIPLEIEKGTNVLIVERIIRNPKGEVIEFYTSAVKPGMYEFRIKMNR